MKTIKFLFGIVLFGAGIWGLISSGAELKMFIASISVMFIGAGIFISAVK